MSKWCTDTDCKPNVQFNNNNDWWSASPDYASNNTIQPNRSPQTPSSMTSDGMASDFYNINNGQNAYDWRTNSGSGIATEDLCPNDYGNDYYYNQVFSQSLIESYLF